MLTRPWLVYIILLGFSAANLYLIVQSLKNENVSSMLLASLAIIGVGYFLQIYKKLRREMNEDEPTKQHSEY